MDRTRVLFVLNVSRIDNKRAQFAFRASSFVIGQFSINETKSMCAMSSKNERRGLHPRYNKYPSSTLPRNTSRFQFKLSERRKIGIELFTCVLLVSISTVISLSSLTEIGRKM